MNRRFCLVGFVTVITCALLAGCSNSGGRIGVGGAVTLDGKPLENGLINFQPAPGVEAPSAGGAIANGSYDLPANSGLMPGEYRVIIQAFKKTGKQIVNPQTKQMIPEILTVQIREAGNIKATVGKEKRFDFTLSSAP